MAEGLGEVCFGLTEQCSVSLVACDEIYHVPSKSSLLKPVSSDNFPKTDNARKGALYFVFGDVR